MCIRDRRYIELLAGTVIGVAGFQVFTVPLGFYNGGTVGLAQILRTLLTDQMCIRDSTRTARLFPTVPGTKPAVTRCSIRRPEIISLTSTVPHASGSIFPPSSPLLTRMKAIPASSAGPASVSYTHLDVYKRQI